MENNILNIPKELILKIFQSIPNLSKLRELNKEYKNLIDDIFEYYNKKFNSVCENWKNNFDKLINRLIGDNDINSVLFLYNNYKESHRDINFYAAYYDNKSLFNLLPLNDAQQIANGAALGGHIDIVKREIKNGASDYEEIANNAALGGHENIVKYAVEVLKVKNLVGLVHNAVISKNSQLVKYIVSLGMKNFNYIAAVSAANGIENILKYAVKNGANNFEQIGEVGAAGNHLHIVVFALNNNARNLNEMAYAATRNGFLNIVEFLDQYSNKSLNYKEIARIADEYGYLYIKNYALSNCDLCS